ncbi:MAG: hypothetical protein ACT6Q8_22715 [Niveispirillum sp.]|uniref:hypothetical protein n=1 Tax=Niveispirillum sp. TaxID=1917217 RepID=UPI004036CCDA
MHVEYPAYELQAEIEALRAIANGLTGMKVELANHVWLGDNAGRSWLVTVQPRDLCFKFEVFSLAISSIEQLQARWREWKPPVLPTGIPEPLRSQMSVRPPEPTAPLGFDNWPFVTRQVEVLRRVEWIADLADAYPASGDNPNVQSATRAGQIPASATATCEVAVGLLFNGTQDERLLIAADWMPMNLIFTREADKIDAFLVDCNRIELRTYMRSPSP